MSLQQWCDNAWIRAHEPSATEIAELLGIAEREISDASLAGISADGRFDNAYSAVRILCQCALCAHGYDVVKGAREHERTIDSLRFTLGTEWGDEADYFDRCRRRRHQSLYERSRVASTQDADELLAHAKKLSYAVREWLQSEHPELLLSR
jgi:hypothetical protein